MGSEKRQKGVCFVLCCVVLCLLWACLERTAAGNAAEKRCSNRNKYPSNHHSSANTRVSTAALQLLAHLVGIQRRKIMFGERQLGGKLRTITRELELGYLTTHVPAPTPKQLFYNGSLQHTVAMQSSGGCRRSTAGTSNRQGALKPLHRLFVGFELFVLGPQHPGRTCVSRLQARATTCGCDNICLLLPLPWVI